jgi:hypothetical protein
MPGAIGTSASLGAHVFQEAAIKYLSTSLVAAATLCGAAANKGRSFAYNFDGHHAVTVYVARNRDTED